MVESVETGTLRRTRRDGPQQSEFLFAQSPLPTERCVLGRLTSSTRSDDEYEIGQGSTISVCAGC